MTKKIYIIITQPLHLYPQNFQKKKRLIFYLEKKIYKQFERKYLLIKKMIFIEKFVLKKLFTIENLGNLD